MPTAKRAPRRKTAAKRKPHPKTGNPVGRPSRYKPEFCARVIELGKEGKGPVHYASEFEVCKATIILWGNEHPEFMTALTRAKSEEQVWWETKAQENLLEGGKMNAPVWKKSMEARFRDEYTERKELDIGLTDGLADRLKRAKERSK